MPVADLDRELLGRGLAFRQIVGGVVGNRVGPAHRPRLGGRVLAHRAHGERAAQRVAASGVTLVACTSIRSTSLNVMVPVAVRSGVVSSSVTEPVVSVAPATIVGASLVP